MLKFIYGVMGSSKTAQALILAHDIQTRMHRRVYLLKPSVDTRSPRIESRLGISGDCLTFTPTDNILDIIFAPGNADRSVPVSAKPAVIIDEAQFCTPTQVEQLREFSTYDLADVFCFGLKTTYKAELFPGSRRLLELADSIEEIPSFCSCGAQATQNALFLNDTLQTDGPDTIIGDTEYRPLCYNCYKAALADAARGGNIHHGRNNQGKPR